MTLATAPGDDDGVGAGAVDLVVEDITTGVFASGYGHLGDGRRFSFRVERARLLVEVYRPRSAGPVPVPEDVVATASRGLTDLDLTDARSLLAAVRDAIAAAESVR